MDKSFAPLVVPELPSGELLSVRVLKVFDGDGLLASIRHPVTERDMQVSLRFGFTDAPEMGQYGGQEAKDFLTFLIDGKWIEISVLTTMDTGGITDRHGRIVCVPYLTHILDDRAAVPALAERLWAPISFLRNVELEMVVNGWSWVLDRYGPDARYYEALDEARRHRRGIWARDDNVNPWEFKKRMYREAKRGTDQTRQANLFT